MDWIWGMAMTHKGTVKWFSNVNGYGFIEYGDEDIFVHFTGIKMDGYRTLKEGQAVQFDAIEGARGLQATNVVLLDDKSEDEGTTHLEESE